MPKSRETCTECSTRRQKCDRGVPCGRCVKRGKADSCTRQWSQHHGPRRSVAGRHEQRPDTLLSPSSRNPRSDSVSPSGGIEALHTVENGSEISTLDFMTWKPSERVTEPGITRADNQPTLGNSERLDSEQSNITFLQLLLPNVRLMWKLVNFHEKKLLWYHGCYHGPTFNSQLQERIEPQGAREDHVLQIQMHDLQWTALLFSILAGSMTCASEGLLVEWGLSKTESLQLCTRWYTATTTLLRLGNYTSDHNILGAQAIATLTMCAHTLGFSSDLHVHLGSAVRIAQSLNLHRIRPDDRTIDIGSSLYERQAVLTKEIGRRLWSQLCIQDWFSLPLAEAHSIHRGHFTTEKPGNRDHITMIPVPDSSPTYVSYGNYLYEIAALIADLHARTAGLNTDFTRYQLILEYDSRMRQLATQGRPHYFDVTVPVEETWPWFVPWARRSLTICFGHKIMMIHRAFLKRSFTNTAFSFTRRTCIAASKTILNEAKFDRGKDEPIIWIDDAFCIAAAITLALDVCHRDPVEPEHDMHKALVEDCIQSLQKHTKSTLASRGVRLLQILLKRSSQGVGQDLAMSIQVDNNEIDPQQSSTSAVPILHAVHGASIARDNQIGLQDSSSGVQTGTVQKDNLVQVLDLEQPSIDDLFAELFPPQAGFSNAYLFEELLDLSLGR